MNVFFVWMVKKVEENERFELRFPLKRDILVERWRALVALWQEVEAYAADVLGRLERGGVIHLVALYLELQQAEVRQAYLVAPAQVAADDLRQA